MSRIRQQITIEGSKVWVTGENIRSLLQNCVCACSKIMKPEPSEKNGTNFIAYAERFYSLYKNKQ